MLDGNAISYDHVHPLAGDPASVIALDHAWADDRASSALAIETTMDGRELMGSGDPVTVQMELRTISEKETLADTDTGGPARRLLGGIARERRVVVAEIAARDVLRENGRLTRRDLKSLLALIHVDGSRI